MHYYHLVRKMNQKNKNEETNRTRIRLTDIIRICIFIAVILVMFYLVIRYQIKLVIIPFMIFGILFLGIAFLGAGSEAYEFLCSVIIIPFLITQISSLKNNSKNS